jgi:hypothetical protein
MMDELEYEPFDDAIALALAQSTDFGNVVPRAEVKRRLMARLTPSPVPDGFSLRMADDDDWVPHPVPGIRMKVLSVNRASGYATLLLDMAPGTSRTSQPIPPCTVRGIGRWHDRDKSAPIRRREPPRTRH